MSAKTGGEPIAILAGGGTIPGLVASAAARSGRAPLVFALAGEASQDSFPEHQVFSLRWGELGRFFRLAGEAGCREATFVGSVSRRPELRHIRPDFGAVALLPRVARLLRNGDDTLLSGIAEIFAEKGIRLVSPVDVASELSLPVGVLTGTPPDESLRSDIASAANAARMLGRLDIGQAAVAVAGRVVAVEGAEGTDGLLERVAALRKAGRITARGGVLVKCMKPQQDPRLDVPTLGPHTAELAGAAGLDGVAAEAGRTLLAGRHETIAAFRAHGLFLTGVAAPASPVSE